MINKTEKKIDKMIQSNISFSLNFEKINKRIDYSSLIEKKKIKQINLIKRLSSFAVAFIVVCSCLSLSFFKTKDYEEPMNEYHKILNQKDFAFYAGSQCPLPPTFEHIVLNQKDEYRPRSFYKVKVYKISNMFTGAYIPTKYYDNYYNDFNKYVDMSQYTHINEFFYFYKNVILKDEDAKPIIWQDFEGEENIQKTIKEGEYTLVMLLRLKDVDLISNESQKRMINLTKRLYINTAFRIIDDKVSVFDYDIARYLIDMEGTYFWAARERAIEDNDLMFTFATPSYLDLFCNFINYDDIETVELPLYITEYLEDSEHYSKQYYGSFYEKILDTVVKYNKNGEKESMYCDYAKLSSIIYE